MTWPADPFRDASSCSARAALLWYVNSVSTPRPANAVVIAEPMPPLPPTTTTTPLPNSCSVMRQPSGPLRSALPPARRNHGTELPWFSLSSSPERDRARHLASSIAINRFTLFLEGLDRLEDVLRSPGLQLIGHRQIEGLACTRFQ